MFGIELYIWFQQEWGIIFQSSGSNEIGMIYDYDLYDL
jgi:hypothetical protein